MPCCLQRSSQYLHAVTDSKSRRPKFFFHAILCLVHIKVGF